MAYKVIFDSTSSEAGWLLSYSIPLLLALLLLSLVVFFAWASWRTNFKARILTVTLVLLLLFRFGLSFSFAHYKYFHWWYDKGPFSAVEGPVEKYRASNVGTTSYEHFQVGNAGFSYTAARMDRCFHKTAANGGPIHDGLLVRITYHDNCIVKLEVAQEQLSAK